MAKTFKGTTKLQTSVEDALQVLIDPEFQVARETAQDTCLASKTEEVSRSDDKLVFKVINTEYAKGVTGIDRSKTEQVSYTYTWDLAKKRCTWTYQSKHSDKGVKVYGSVTLEPGPKDTALVHDEFTVEVNIPLVGGKVEKAILKEIEAGWPAYERILRQWAEK